MQKVFITAKKVSLLRAKVVSTIILESKIMMENGGQQKTLLLLPSYEEESRLRLLIGSKVNTPDLLIVWINSKPYSFPETMKT